MKYCSDNVVSNDFDLKYCPDNVVSDDFDLKYCPDNVVSDDFDLKYCPDNVVSNDFDLKYCPDNVVSDDFDFKYCPDNIISNDFDLKCCPDNAVSSSFDFINKHPLYKWWAKISAFEFATSSFVANASCLSSNFLSTFWSMVYKSVLDSFSPITFFSASYKFNSVAVVYETFFEK